ncbi:Non-homologous end joining protein Ku [Usitatibacter rugosus]|uniref:Non-homologous end joining protein Ku n=1 Tax=Usitatibacter rugosus TaxID=2732067 RepID=A0A6M4GX23_9PROT|nr:Ku protein [Usitatibacter rugosus]QJR11054.1 Non-homologous end joining protein Ku [Usitatibacter rugosus]
MPRPLWKGAISFGLVNVPVAIYPAASRDGISFDWLDKRDMAPVGYKRVNKETGKEVPKEQIVKGLEYEDGHYVVLSDAEIKSANTKATQTIDIVAFVDAECISPLYFDSPYYVAPGPRGDKVYALLRETMRKEGKVGVAYVVLQTKQHLAAVLVQGNHLVMMTLRWASEMRDAKAIDVPPASLKSSGVRDNEIKMATQLLKDMSEKWEPGQYHDKFHDDIMALVKKKVAAGKTEEVMKPEKEAEEKPSNVIDLTELLKQSLAKKGDKGRKAPAASVRKTPARKAAARKPAASQARRRAA